MKRVKNVRMCFSVVVDDLDYHGPLTKPQRFTVTARSEDECWMLAENEARVLCTAFGRVFEFNLSLEEI